LTDRASFEEAGGNLFARLPINEYLEIARHWKWWIILSTIALAVAAATVAARLPNVYSAAVIVKVDAQKVPSNFVPSPVNSGLDERLGEIQAQLFSATNLRNLISTMNLYPEQRGGISDDEIVQYMRRSITIDTVVQNGRPVSAFRISYRGRNPVVVTEVANRLANGFIEENLKVRATVSSGTAEFLEAELQRTKEELEKKETELRSIKTRYVMDLPESQQFHVQALDSLQRQMRDSGDRVREDERQKAYLQSMMASYPPTADLDSGVSGGRGSGNEPQIQKLEARLAELRLRYGPAHPDVLKVQADLDDLKKKAAEEEANHPTVQVAPQQAPRVIHNPVLESQIAKLDDEIKAQKKLQQDLQPQVDFHMSKLGRIPIVEEQMTELTRDYETLRQHYLTVLEKKLAADEANRVENGQKGEHFVVLDPAHIPDAPIGPKRLFITLAGLIAGVACGIGLAVVREITDRSVRNELEAAEVGGAPVLVCVPPILCRKDLVRRRTLALVAVSATVGIALGLGFVTSSFVARFF
jgi:polysaccharide chain length determinant protein (PEP-CTERM system associated)